MILITGPLWLISATSWAGWMIAYVPILLLDKLQRN